MSNAEMEACAKMLNTRKNERTKLDRIFGEGWHPESGDRVPALDLQTLNKNATDCTMHAYHIALARRIQFLIGKHSGVQDGGVYYLDDNISKRYKTRGFYNPWGSIISTIVTRLRTGNPGFPIPTIPHPPRVSV